MKCKNCGEFSKEGTAFCSKCGTKLEQEQILCSCGNRIEPDTFFCDKCGARVSNVSVTNEVILTIERKKQFLSYGSIHVFIDNIEVARLDRGKSFKCSLQKGNIYEVKLSKAPLSIGNPVYSPNLYTSIRDLFSTKIEAKDDISWRFEIDRSTGEFVVIESAYGVK